MKNSVDIEVVCYLFDVHVWIWWTDGMDIMHGFIKYDN